MTEFASCYFCGTALDAQIEPYPVVPEDAGADDRPTVDLCPVCRRKLSKVLDVALSAADDAEASATPLAAGPDPSPLEADHEDPTADLGAEDETAEEPTYAVEPGGEATAVEDAPEPDADGAVDDEAEADGPAQDDGAEDSDDESADESGADDEPGATTIGDESASAESVTEADGAIANGETPETAADDAEPEKRAADEQSEAGDGETGQSGADQPSILSTPAAQKVIKLLQNREFPVEREEIEVVASNAYAIPDRDCADVIDALISEGYVGERKGQLVRPDE